MTVQKYVFSKRSLIYKFDWHRFKKYQPAFRGIHLKHVFRLPYTEKSFSNMTWLNRIRWGLKRTWVLDRCHEKKSLLNVQDFLPNCNLTNLFQVSCAKNSENTIWVLSSWRELFKRLKNKLSRTQVLCLLNSIWYFSNPSQSTSIWKVSAGIQRNSSQTYLWIVVYDENSFFNTTW